MPYGRLTVIKSLGSEPVFCIADEEFDLSTNIPSLMDWMLARIGTLVEVSVTDTQFSITMKTFKS